MPNLIEQGAHNIRGTIGVVASNPLSSLHISHWPHESVCFLFLNVVEWCNLKVCEAVSIVNAESDNIHEIPNRIIGEMLKSVRLSKFPQVVLHECCYEMILLRHSWKVCKLAVHLLQLWHWKLTILGIKHALVLPTGKEGTQLWQLSQHLECLLVDDGRAHVELHTVDKLGKFITLPSLNVALIEWKMRNLRSGVFSSKIAECPIGVCLSELSIDELSIRECSKQFLCGKLLSIATQIDRQNLVRLLLEECHDFVQIVERVVSELNCNELFEILVLVFVWNAE
mmetsp:Transcript_1687/g.5921  ORF Transcript_1687/g.5921 Transcript_1687/m.5921 type:complete len:283 (-) Transcript_1687:545-1393(-)